MKRVKEIKLLLVASLILMVFITPNVSAMSIDGFDEENELIIIDDSKNIVEDTLDERFRSTSLPTTALDLSKNLIKRILFVLLRIGYILMFILKLVRIELLMYLIICLLIMDRMLELLFMI